MGGFKLLTRTANGVEQSYYQPVNDADGLTGLLDSDTNIEQRSHFRNAVEYLYWWSHASGTGSIVGDVDYLPDDLVIDIDPSIVDGTPAGSFEFPLLDLGLNASVEIFWGDDTSDVITSVGQAELTHVYPDFAPRQPYMRPSGTSPWIWGFSPTGDPAKFVTLVQAGVAEQVQIYDANVANMNGSSQWFNMGIGLSTGAWTAMSHSIWLNPNTVSGNCIIMATGIGSDSAFEFYRIGSDVTFQWRVLAGNVANATDSVTAVGALSVGQECLITGTHNGTSGSLYINGVLIGSSTSNMLFQGTSLTRVGRLNDSLPYLLNGVVDNFMVHDRATSQAEETAKYSTGISKCYDLLVINQPSLSDAKLAVPLFNGAGVDVGQELVCQAGSGITTINEGATPFTGSAQVECEVYAHPPIEANDLVITVDTTQAGSASDTFIFPLIDMGLNASIEVFYPDDTSAIITSISDPNLTKVFDAPVINGGIYYRAASPFIWGFDGGDEAKLVSVDQEGLAEQLETEAMALSVREHKSGAGSVQMDFTQGADFVEVAGAGSTFGNGYLGVNLSTALLKASTIEIDWEGASTGGWVGAGGVCLIDALDGARDRSSGIDFPSGSAPPSQGAGKVILANEPNASFARKTSVFSGSLLNAFSQSQTFLNVRCNDYGTSGSSIAIIKLYSIVIKNAEGFPTHAWSGSNTSLNMEVTGTQGDYGISS